MKTRPYMSYPQVAAIVVQVNLKNPGMGLDSEGLCSQSNIQENDSCWDESNLATSARKVRQGTSVGDDNLDATSARRRSRKESNLRRRIYDAWNVLKAANIIVEFDDKHFRYNPAILQDFDFSPSSKNEELIEEQLQLTIGKPAHSLKSSGS